MRNTQHKQASQPPLCLLTCSSCLLLQPSCEAAGQDTLKWLTGWLPPSPTPPPWFSRLASKAKQNTAGSAALTALQTPTTGARNQQKRARRRDLPLAPSTAQNRKGPPPQERPDQLAMRSETQQQKWRCAGSSRRKQASNGDGGNAQAQSVHTLRPAGCALG